MQLLRPTEIARESLDFVEDLKKVEKTEGDEYCGGFAWIEESKLDIWMSWFL